LTRHKLEVWPGYVTSIRQHENSLLLCVDISHKVFNIGTVAAVSSHVPFLGIRVSCFNLCEVQPCRGWNSIISLVSQWLCSDQDPFLWGYRIYFDNNLIWIRSDSLFLPGMDSEVSRISELESIFCWNRTPPLRFKISDCTFF
jgi:hypothetical protein